MKKFCKRPCFILDNIVPFYYKVFYLLRYEISPDLLQQVGRQQFVRTNREKVHDVGTPRLN